MRVELNHTIVFARDREASAHFVADILGLEVGEAWGPFLPVSTSNGVRLDFVTSDQDSIAFQHYAFLVSDEDFEAVLERLRKAGVTYYPEPNPSRPGEINYNHGGRGLYFFDPAGHGLEVITRPYGNVR